MPYRIVVADPSVSVRKTLQSVLNEPEFRLYPVSSGDELLRSFDEVDPDAVIVSLTLPGMRSGEFGRMLKGRPGRREVPLVALHGMFEPCDSDPAEMAEFDAVFQKPFDSGELAEGLRLLISSKSGPTSIPELADWAGGGQGRNDAPESGGAGQDGAGVPPVLQRLVRAEVQVMERELEKRIKTGVLEEIKSGRAGDKR